MSNAIYIIFGLFLLNTIYGFRGNYINNSIAQIVNEYFGALGYIPVEWLGMLLLAYLGPYIKQGINALRGK